jgi:hypothetical protein
VVSCEAFQPAPGRSRATALQYADTGLCAALAGPQVALLGFPLETVLPAGARAKLLAAARSKASEHTGSLNAGNPPLDEYGRNAV